MVTPRPSPFRTLWLIACSVALSLFLASCGNGPARSSTTEHTGSGGLMIGQPRGIVEANNPKWTIHAEKPDGPTLVVVYRDYHWSLARGFAHSAEYHHVTYNSGHVVAWVSNSNPNATKE